MSLKALAIQALERNTSRNSPCNTLENRATERATDAPFVATLVAPLATHFEERAAIAEYDGGAPRAWAETFAALQCLPVPEGISAAIWIAMIDRAGRWLDREGGRP